MLMTPVSWNSSQRSLPSRVRSPTPANTDTPPCFMATLLISSLMMTVLPTPAPPNRPILPPRRYGSSRSMTLMPVSNIFSSVDCSSSDGACAVDRPVLLGVDRPIRSRPARRARSCTRPSVAGPTGTEIGAPVSIDRHAAPHAVGRLHRDRAHAVLAEMLLDLGDDVDASAASARLGDDADGVVDRGQCPPANSTSTTGPMTWTTLPIFCAVAVAVAICSLVSVSRARVLTAAALCYSARARHDLDDLARDRRLTDLVHVERQLSIISARCASPRPSPSSARRRTPRSTRAARG